MRLDDWREGIAWGVLLLSAALVLIFLIAAGVSYWAGAPDLAYIAGIGALASAVLLPAFALLVHLEGKEKKAEEVNIERMMLPLIIAGFLGVIALYAGLRMVGVTVEPELVALALIGLTVIGVLWIIRGTPRDMEDLRRTLQQLSEKVDRLSRLLEE